MKMKSYFSCDICGDAKYTEANPMIECRSPRPSNPNEICCVLAGHQTCLRVAELKPSVTGGAATAKQWEAWAAGPEARAAGVYLG